MARWKFTRGQKTGELLEHTFFDLRKLPVQHLKEIVSRIAATANKRLKRLSDTGIHGPAYEQAMTAGKFGVGGKTQEQLISEFERAKQFMQNPTSTTAGVIKTYTETVKEAYEASGREIDEEEIIEEVRKAGGEVIKRKGATFYAIALTINKLCDDVLRDSNNIRTVSFLMDGKYGISDVCLSLPAVVGGGGIIKKIYPNMTEPELSKLRASADALKKVIASLDMN
jgi:hypothetical protein